jgi:hypothetical protein
MPHARAAVRRWCGIRRWCGREDSNLHGVAPASPSSWCVYQFRHCRKAGSTITKAYRADSIRQGFFSPSGAGACAVGAGSAGAAASGLAGSAGFTSSKPPPGAAGSAGASPGAGAVAAGAG